VSLFPVGQDLAKVADLVLMLINGHTGFEMETFEFMNVMQVHGFPKVRGRGRWEGLTVAGSNHCSSGL
jgi:hypothetical protein